MFEIFVDRRASRFIWIVIAALLSLAAPSARAQQSSEPLALDEALEIGLRLAPQIAASVSSVEGSQAARRSAGRLPDPELVAALDNVPVTGDERWSLTQDFMTMQRIGIMQTFPTRQKRRLQGERAAREVALAEAQLRKAHFQTARMIGEAWISAAVAERSVERLRTLKPDLELQATAARASLASGRSSAADALKAERLLLSVEDRILALEQQAEARKAELARWIGAAANRPLAPIPADRALLHPAADLVTDVPEHAPLAPLDARIEATQTEVALARAEKRPDWSTLLGYSNRGPDFSDMISLEFRMGLPLFPAHRRDPLIAQALAQVRAQEAEREAEIRMHAAEVRSMLAQFRIGRERLERYAKDVLPLVRDRFRVALDSYRAGRGDLQSLFEAASDEIEQEINYIELQGEVARAWTFLHLLHDSATSAAAQEEAR
jgi:cobalt-zinc-cadmium efflux system outer membrane protein